MIKVLELGVLASLVLIGCSEDTQPPSIEPPSALDTGLHFIDVTKQAGLEDFKHETGAEGDMLFPESMGSGCGFIDYDGDGWVDILVAGGGSWAADKNASINPVWLYRNNGDGTFSLKTEEAGLGDLQAYSLGFAVADYDNDGDQDFYLTAVGENLLLRNEGGFFTEVGKQANVAGAQVWSSASIFFDADRDGWLDLYVGNYVEWSPETDLFCTLDGTTKDYCTPQSYAGIPGRYYHNKGDGTFEDRTEELGFLAATGKALGVIEMDANGDNWPDLVVANDTDPNQHFVNQGDGSFIDRGTISGLAYDESGKTRAGMGIDAGVVDSTGELTVFVGHFTQEMIGVWRHRGKGVFVDRAAASRIGRPSLQTLTFGLFLFDADLDSNLDLFAANGHVNPGIEQISEVFTHAQPVHLFINRGNGTFHDVAPQVGGVLQKEFLARGAAFADYDRDGDLDILISENGGGVHLWQNGMDSDAFVRVRVEGVVSNRSGLGTRLVAYVNDTKKERRIVGGATYLSASEQVATFGLGTATQLDSLTVYWPSGQIEHLGPLEKGQEVFVREGEEVRMAQSGVD